VRRLAGVAAPNIDDRHRAALVDAKHDVAQRLALPPGGSQPPPRPESELAASRLGQYLG